MGAKSTRLQLADALKPLLPRGWKIEPSSRTVDKIKSPVVQLKQRGFRRVSGSRVYAIEFECNITAPQETTLAAEDKLDDDAVTLAGSLTSAGILWDEFTKGTTVDTKQLAYTTTLTVRMDQLKG